MSDPVIYHIWCQDGIQCHVIRLTKYVYMKAEIFLLVYTNGLLLLCIIILVMKIKQVGLFA